MTFTAATVKKLRALGIDGELLDAVLAIFEEAREAKTKKKGGADDRKERGTRLPDNWKLPDEWRQYAISIGLRPHEVNREEAKFRNYWSSQAGVKGIKLRWDSTWRNWCISMLERAGRPVTPPDSTASAASNSPAGPEAFTEETWRAIAKRYKVTGQWSPEWGPTPNNMDCLMPAALL